jgi:hypothetical protein
MCGTSWTRVLDQALRQKYNLQTDRLEPYYITSRCFRITSSDRGLFDGGFRGTGFRLEGRRGHRSARINDVSFACFADSEQWSVYKKPGGGNDCSEFDRNVTTNADAHKIAISRSWTPEQAPLYWQLDGETGVVHGLGQAEPVPELGLRRKAEQTCKYRTRISVRP